MEALGQAVDLPSNMWVVGLASSDTNGPDTTFDVAVVGDDTARPCDVQRFARLLCAEVADGTSAIHATLPFLRNDGTCVVTSSLSCEDDDDGLSGGAIAGIVFGSITAVVLVAALVLLSKSGAKAPGPTEPIAPGRAEPVA